MDCPVRAGAGVLHGRARSGQVEPRTIRPVRRRDGDRRGNRRRPSAVGLFGDRRIGPVLPHAQDRADARFRPSPGPAGAGVRRVVSGQPCMVDRLLANQQTPRRPCALFPRGPWHQPAPDRRRFVYAGLGPYGRFHDDRPCRRNGVGELSALAGGISVWRHPPSQWTGGLLCDPLPGSRLQGAGRHRTKTPVCCLGRCRRRPAVADQVAGALAALAVVLPALWIVRTPAKKKILVGIGAASRFRPRRSWPRCLASTRSRK